MVLSGFGGSEKVWLSECADAVDVNADGCGAQLAAQPFAMVDGSGGRSVTFPVSSTAGSKPYDVNSFEPCTNNCVLVATIGGAPSSADAFAYAPLTFSGG